MRASFRITVLAAGLGAFLPAAAADDAAALFLPQDTTHSIIAVDPATGELGLGMRSKAFAVDPSTA